MRATPRLLWYAAALLAVGQAGLSLNAKAQAGGPVSQEKPVAAPAAKSEQE